MRSSSIAAVALAALSACAAAPAEPAFYRLDPKRTAVHFEVSRFGLSTIRGRFGPAQGEVALDRNTGRGHVGLSLPTASVDTGSPQLDSRLRQGDMLASDRHPDAYFVADGFSFDKDAPLKEVHGDFVLRGQRRPMVLKVLRFACHMSAQLLREVCGGDFEATFNRSEFGATFGLPFVGDRVKLLVAMEAVRQGDDD